MKELRMDDPSLSQWQWVCRRLREEVGDAAYQSWVKPMTLGGVRDGLVHLAVPTPFLRDWVVVHYAERIRALWADGNPEIRAVKVDVAKASLARSSRPAPPITTALTAHVKPMAAPTSTMTSPRSEVSTPPSCAQKSHGGDALAARLVSPPSEPTCAPPLDHGHPVGDGFDDGLSAPLDSRYTFDNFVTGKPNEFAYAAAQRVADSDRVAFNPLFLYGGVGLGKTHLMHAIAWAIRDRHHRRRVIYLSAEKFMYSFVKALRYKTTMDFKEQFRSVDVLMIDDVQFISGKDSTQEEFFHTFNALVDQGRQIVISADKSPADLEDIGDRLRSRLASGLVADIHPTTYELRLGILEAKADQMETMVPEKVLEFLAHKITSNVRELEGALTRLVAHAQLVGRALNLETAQDVLRDVLRANDRRITIEDIQKKVAEHFRIRLADMGSARRSRSVARPRQVAMYLSKQLTNRSLPEIGRKFGGRDHTTVMHAVKKIEDLMDGDGDFADDVNLLRRMLEA